MHLEEHVLRVEGVNFDNCLYDTNNLAVIRGASLLLDQVERPVAKAIREALGKDIVPEWAGGSKALFRFVASEVVAKQVESCVRSALAKEPWKHLSWVVDRVSGEGAEVIAESRNRARQMRSWSVQSCALPGAKRQDALDGMRPADPACDDPRGPLSPATRSRLAYGRQQRQGFWQDRIGSDLAKEITFCDDFEDIVKDCKAPVSEAASSKIAVLQFDGDGFGKIIDAAGGSAGFAAKFSEISRNLLSALVRRSFDLESKEGNKPSTLLRMEVLLWGGDDMTVVVPCWRALDMIAAFYDAAQTAQIAGRGLSFTGAAIIAQRKAPIRRLRALAEEAVGLTKSAAPGSFTMDVFEAASPPEDGLEAHRARVHPGLSAAELSFPGAKAGALAENIRRCQREAGRSNPSRTALHRLLLMQADETLEEGMTDYFTRVLGNPVEELQIDRFLPGTERSLRADLRLLLDFWDYVPQKRSVE